MYVTAARGVAGMSVTAEDMAEYQPEWTEPVRFTYRGHEMVGSPAPDTGGLTVGFNLNVLENFDLKSMGSYMMAPDTLEIMTRTMARTFGADNVRVNTVLPGWVFTERQLAKWWTPEGEAKAMVDQCLKRRILPDEFAQMVLFLAADDSKACTAQSFMVDAGRY